LTEGGGASICAMGTFTPSEHAVSMAKAMEHAKRAETRLMV
jgi:hypothetical protein